MSISTRVQEAIEEIRQGKMVIMLDDEDRENEGDLVCSATFCTPEKINFMVTHARGLVCLSLDKKNAKRLELNPMETNNTSSYETAFTVSVDAKDAKTGISAGERNDAVQILANPLSKPSDLVRPGHIFPLIAKDGGVLARTGHTEGSMDLCKLARLSGEAVICEIMNEDGTMARRDDLDNFAKKHNLRQVYVSDLVQYRMSHETLVKEQSSKEVKFCGQNALQKTFKDHLDNIHTAFIFGDVAKTSHVKFHTVSKDINLFLDDKLDSMVKTIEFLQAKGGVFIFLESKIPKETNMRDFGIGAQILSSLKIEDIKLLTSGGKYSFVGIQGFGLNVIEEIQIS